MEKLTQFERMFHPRSVAVIGASANEAKFGGRYMATLQEFGFKGELYPVNPNETEVSGRTAYPTVRDVPGPIDFAIISVPARAVPTVLEDCVAKGVPAAEIFTAGFSETGEDEGRRLEAEVVNIARKGIKLIGPNCFGIYCPAGGLTLLPGSDFPRESGPVAFISQSGGHATEFARDASGWGIRFSKVVSYGNACDINEADLLEYLAQDEETQIIAAYIEGPRAGRRLLSLVQEVSMSKPVVIWKAGLTEDGARAVRSHTASLAGEEAIWNALFKQTPALQVSNLEELIETTVALQHLPPTVGRRVAVIGGGGGVSVAAADACNRSGLEVPPFVREIQEQLRQILPPAGTSIRNPVDVGGPVVPPFVLQKVLETAAGAENVDTLIATQALHLFINESNRMRALFETAGNFIEDSLRIPVETSRKHDKPIVMVLPVGSTEVRAIDTERQRRQYRDHYLGQGVPVYPSLERAARAVARVVEYHRKVAEIKGT